MGRAQSGVSEAQLRDLHRHEESEAFTEAEKAALTLAQVQSGDTPIISDGLFARLRRAFTEAQLVELAAVIAHENFRARFNRVFDLGPDGFSEGAFCPLPVRPLALPPPGNDGDDARA